MFMTFLSLLLRDIAFLAVLAILVIPLCIWKRAAFAVLKRNFIGYFSNPTGYVFLFLFVLLTSVSAFWPAEFFNANLANLGQLNRWLPFIMLIFIPAITMSVWAEERRQGTDELLLTLPAGDFDVVIGKYLAAAAVFTASLLFSQISSFGVLASLTLGDLDVGLFFATYLGYWFVGMAMLSIGMVASFLTSNLTVGFVLGALFNVPLVFAVWADNIIASSTMARLVSSWSLASQFDDFGRGVVSLGSIIYFVLLMALGLYLSMVLIGSRHWLGGRDGTPMLGHYLVRALSLVAIALGVNYVFANSELLSRARQDMTEGNISSLSPESLQLLRELKAEHAIKIEAFIDAQVPEAYAQTKADLVSTLKEFRAASASDIDVQIHLLDKDSENAIEIKSQAEERYGIVPEMVRTRVRGAIKDEEVMLAAAFTSGLEKVVVPFFDYGIPVEYEVIRSICTVAKNERKKVGILQTDVKLFGGASFAGGRFQQIPKQALVVELEKQYDVEEVDPTSPIELGVYDVLLAVQPSSLSPEAFDNFFEAVRSGQPTAIFEDPRPFFMQMAPATGEPKMPPGGMGGMMGQQQGPQPKGDIQKLWDLLGLRIDGESGGMMGLFSPDLVWQRFMPYKKLQVRGIPNEWVFCREDAPGGEGCINPDSPITSGLGEIFFPVPGALKASADSDLKFTKLVTTGTAAGTVSFQDFMGARDDREKLLEGEGAEKGSQIIAARIQGELPESISPAETNDQPEGEAKNGEAKDGGSEQDKAIDEEVTPHGIDVVYVADIDLMISTFLRIRARPDEDDAITWQFENVDFLLNIIDVLSGDDAYINIRKRKSRHSTLRLVDAQTQVLRDEESSNEAEYRKKFNDTISAIEEENQEQVQEFEKKLQELQDKQRQEGHIGIRLTDLAQAAQELDIQRARLQRKLDVRRAQLERERDENIKRKQVEIESEIAGIKNWYKVLAVFIPAIPPLLIGLIVFVRRRLREREGVSRARML